MSLTYVQTQEQKDLLAAAERHELEASQLRDAAALLEKEWWDAKLPSVDIAQSDGFMSLVAAATPDNIGAQHALAMKMFELYGETFKVPQMATIECNSGSVVEHPVLRISDKGWELPLGELVKNIKSIFKTIPEKLWNQEILDLSYSADSDLPLKPIEDDEWVVTWEGNIFGRGSLESILTYRMSGSV